MHHHQSMPFATPNRQQGAALFMALIVLLVLTILGVFGMNVARLENLMAGNTLFQTKALNSAEGTLAVGEQDVESILGTSSVNWGTDTGYYDRTALSTNIIHPEAADWSTFTSKPDPNNPKSRYVIEYTGEYKDLECSLKQGAAHADPCRRYIFLVTAQNESSRGAKRTVQSVYVSATPP